MIVSGGMSYIVPALMRQLEEFRLDVDRVNTMLILHAHFDHVGIIPFFRRRNPDVTVYASKRACEILSLPKSIHTINEFSRSVVERMGMTEAVSGLELDWPIGLSVQGVSAGRVIGLGDMNLHIVETPGHSSCSISAYVSGLKALFPSDAGGIPYKDTMIVWGNSNYTQYQQSLVKLAQLDAEYVCADHYGYVYGDEAKVFIARSIEMAEKERARMEEIYCRTRDVDAAAKELASSSYDDDSEYFLSPEIHEGVCRQMMRHISKCLDVQG